MTRSTVKCKRTFPFYYMFMIGTVMAVQVQHSPVDYGIDREEYEQFWEHPELGKYFEIPKDKTAHHSLCSVTKINKTLDNYEYEFRPNTYTEVKCRAPAEDLLTMGKLTSMCLFPGFKCVPIQRDMYVIKRRKRSKGIILDEGWETETVQVDDCECRFPYGIK